jgi:ribonuclease HI
VRTGIVAYTDGSARPNPGYAGSGVHGYIWELPEEGKNGHRAGKYRITDKGYSEDPTLQGVCVKQYFEIAEPIAYGTNNIAELNAVAALFNHLAVQLTEVDELYIISDSQYVLGGMDKPINGRDLTINQNYWNLIYKGIDLFKLHGTLRTEWVKGHNDNLGNTLSDYLSVLGTYRSTKKNLDPSILFFEHSGYWNEEAEFHPLLSSKRLYFSIAEGHRTPGKYFQVEAKAKGDEKLADGRKEKIKRIHVGARAANLSYSIVNLEEPDPIIESIVQYVTQYAPTGAYCYFLDMNKLRTKNMWRWFKHYGTDTIYCLFDSGHNFRFIDNQPICIEPKPIDLHLRAMDMSAELDMIEKGKLPLTSLDITDKIYDIEIKEVKKGKTVIPKIQYVVKKEFKVGQRSLDVLYKYQNKEIKIPLEVGYSTPTRSAFKSFEKDQPKVELLIQEDTEDHRWLRYFVKVTTNKSSGIWSQHYSNCIYL